MHKCLNKIKKKYMWNFDFFYKVMGFRELSKLLAIALESSVGNP